MALKGLPGSYKMFSTIIIEREKQMTFTEFKTTLYEYEENEKSRLADDKDNTMSAKQKC